MRPYRFIAASLTITSVILVWSVSPELAGERAPRDPIPAPPRAMSTRGSRLTDGCSRSTFVTSRTGSGSRALRAGGGWRIVGHAAEATHRRGLSRTHLPQEPAKLSTRVREVASCA